MSSIKELVEEVMISMSHYDRRAWDKLEEVIKRCQKEARLEERESCAKVAEHPNNLTYGSAQDTSDRIAKAIRNRSKEGV